MKLIGVSGTLTAGQRRAFDALAEAFQVRLVTFEPGKRVDALIRIDLDRRPRIEAGPFDYPCLTILTRESSRDSECAEYVDFSDEAALSAFSGRRVKVHEKVKFSALDLADFGLRAVASTGGIPFWGIRNDGAMCQHFVSLPLPELAENEPLFFQFNWQQFLKLLPLVIFFRLNSPLAEWQLPLKAAFIFDDPNLHWRSYGFVDYRAIAEDAKEHNYHVSFATVPLDSWYVNKRAAQLFAKNKDFLSLLIHGNDHVTKELAGVRDETEAERLLFQALERVKKLEKRSGLEVSKVMAPPHGACSEITLRKMADLGFEGACISRGSLHKYNSNFPWAKTIGFRPSDVISGTTVLPRFPISYNCYNSILISALLGQPILPMGHHQDVSAGLDLLRDIASFINSLDGVNWASMKDIFNSHYGFRHVRSTLKVKLFTSRVRIEVPANTLKIEIESEKSCEPFLMYRINGGEWLPVECGICAGPGHIVEVRAGGPVRTRSAMKKKSFSAWPFLRRQIAETRDRIAPSVRNVTSIFNVPR